MSPERSLQSALLRVGLASSNAVDDCYASAPRYATLSQDQKGIVVDGYELRKWKENQNDTLWKCRRNRGTCKCVIKTDNTTLSILSTNHRHNHEPKTITPIIYNISLTSQWEHFTNRRERKGLRIDNFVYYKSRENSGIITWRCSDRVCGASVETDEALSYRLVKNGSHSHPPRSDEFFISAQVSHGVKRRISLDPSERPQKAVDVSIKKIPAESLHGVNIKRFTYVAKKKKSSKKPPQPRSTRALSEAWIQLMLDDDRNKVEGAELVLDVYDDIVMLGSSMSLMLLQQNNSQLFCDGTFKFAPRGYFQLYSIHVLIETVYTPVVYFLLQNKNYGSYVTMFKMLKRHCPDL